MKKLFQISLTVLLIVATTGFTINKHYCGKKLTGVTVLKATHCGCAGHCKHCRTVTKQIRLADDFDPSEVLSPDEPVALDLFLLPETDMDYFVSLEPLKSRNYDEPSPPDQENLLTLIQSFRC